MYKAKIFVQLKESVLDPQGKAVVNALKSLEFDKVKDVRVGKFFEVLIEEDDENKASDYVKLMCKKLLVNPVIESYDFKLVKI